MPSSDNVVDQVLPFAEYLRSKSWPFGRLIKNSSGFHGECMIKGKSNLFIWVKILQDAERNTATLKEQHMYVMLNKTLIN